jgi:hypothetical protein
MRWTVALVLVAILAVFPALALSDLIRPPCASPVESPLTAGAVLEVMLGRVVENGIVLLLLGAVTVVVMPWLVAGLAVALLALPGKLRNRT